MIRSCDSSLTMLVICGVFVRLTQIMEMQLVLLFRCSTIGKWSAQNVHSN